MREALRLSPLATAVVAGDPLSSEVLFANGALASFMAVVEDDIVGHSLNEFLSLDDEIDLPDESDDAVTFPDVTAILPDGMARKVIVTAARLEGGTCAVYLQDITEAWMNASDLRDLAVRCPLTGLANRAELTRELESHLLSRRLGEGLALIFCDLDGFKEVNDGRGHATGDLVLKEVAARLRRAARPRDVVARLGGDEFVVLCPGILSAEEARNLAEGIRMSVTAAPIAVGEGEYDIGMSAGVSIAWEADTDAGELMRRGDVAMYRAKAAGRGCSVVYAPFMDTEVSAGQELRATVRRMLEEGSLELQERPVIGAADGGALSVFVQARIPGDGDPESARVAIAASALAAQVNWYVLTKSLREGRLAPGQGLLVEASMREIGRSGYVNRLLGLLAAHGGSPSALTLVLPDADLRAATGPSLMALRRLRAASIHIGVTDFGVGALTFGHLRHVPADVLLLAPDLLEDAFKNEDVQGILAALVQAAHRMGRTVIADGVRFTDQAELLSAVECDAMLADALPLEVRGSADLTRRSLTDLRRGGISRGDTSRGDTARGPRGR